MNLASKITFVLFIFLGQIFNGFGQSNEENYRIIPSVTEWIEEVNNWPDSIYRQDNIKVLFNLEKDKNYIALNDRSILESTIDTVPILEVNKSVSLSNIQFHTDENLFNDVALKNIHFNGKFILYKLKNGRFAFKNCEFDKLHQIRLVNTKFYLSYLDCKFNGHYMQNNPAEPLDINFYRCDFKKSFVLSSDQGVPSIFIIDCNFNSYALFGKSSRFNAIAINNSTFLNSLIFSHLQIDNAFEIKTSNLNYINLDGSNLPIENTYVPFHQLSNKIGLPADALGNFYAANYQQDFEDKEAYDRIIASYSKLLAIYKSRSEMDSYNACYIEMRNKQTAYSKFIYTSNKSFSNYIVYQLNVFMHVFSDYGTKPTKAIIFSLYVILAFALIYLFFPNSWDNHGKNRIIDRYTFFMKYMQKEAGIHEVYLEDKQPEIMEYDAFKNLISNSKETVPKFFISTALPLYKWSISSTKLSASVLKRLDIMKGSWSDLPQKKKLWKTILLVAAFLIALSYDIAIKMLNALMLSINTFTTLGFGEIPIKGLPRYLAIIQGFIGWFMLTIFSVSLISQLLN